MKKSNLKLSSLALAVAGCASLSIAVNAAELEEVIVTGTPGGVGISQLDAAFSITSLDSEAIAKFAPKSTADLLKTIPGVWSESGGGVSGANVSVRGVPSNGDAQFVTVALEGVQIYGASTLSFFEQTTLFRIDETIDRVEGLRGGANTVFSNGQSGLTTNFILKEGSEDPEGLVKLTVGDYNLKRVDALHSGPLGGGWNYMIGGYVSRSDGIRDAGFESEEGQQFTVNLTKDFDNGKISIYNRYTDDFGAWYVPVPLNVPGLDVGTFTQISPENRNQVFAIHPSRAGENIDLGNGRGWEGNVFGINFEKEIGNVTISNRFNYTSGDNNTHGLVNDGSAIRAGDVAGTGIRVSDGSVVSDDTFIQGYGYWIVEKDLKSLSNDFSITTELGAHSLTTGVFYSDYSSYDEWSIGNQQPYVVGGSRIADTSISCADLQAAGTGAACWGTAAPFAPAYDGDAERLAFYLHDKWQVNDKLAIDLGLRREDYDVSFDIAFADANGLGAFTNTPLDEKETTYTAGLNYNLNDTSSLFVRVNEGVDFADFDDIRGGALTTAELTQVELGYKWQSDNSHVYLTLFDVELKGNPFQSDPTAPVVIITNESQGLEIDANYNNGNGFNLNLNSTIQSTEQTVGPNPGNDGARLPDVQLRLTPSYDFDLASNLTATVYGAVSYIDDRFSDPANLQPLDSFTKVDLGLLLNQGDSLTYRISVDNANDSDGLTEGDPRGAGITTQGRPILGRSIKASVQYNF